MSAALLFLLGALCALLLIVGFVVWRVFRPFAQFRALLHAADAMRARGDLAGAIKLAEHLTKAPPALLRRAGSGLGYTLAFWYMEDGRYEDAERACRRVLEQKLTPAWEARVRRRLAQSLENQGKDDAARSEESRADALLQNASQTRGETPNDGELPQVLIAQAERLADETRFAEAAQQYEAALASWPESVPFAPNAALRHKAMVQAALAHYQCGHYKDALRWSETALHNGANGMVRLLALRTAGIGSTGLGQWDAAREFKEAALAQSREMHNPEQIARSLIGLASLEQQMGRITDAMRLLEEATQTGGSLVKFDVCVSQAECLQTWGRWDEADDALHRAEAAPAGPLKKTSDRKKQLLLLGRARLEAERENPAAGLPLCETALAAFVSDPKIALWCRAEHVALQAMQAEENADAAIAGTENARLAREESALLAEADARDGDRNTRMVVYAAVARSRFYRRAYDDALLMWKRYLDEKPAPVSVPKALFFRGKCWEGKNEPDFARSLWRDALQTGLDTRYTRLAQKHLDTLPE